MSAPMLHVCTLGLLLLATLTIADSTDTQLCNEDCPLWTTAYQSSNNTCECKCGSDLNGMVICEDGKGATDVSNCFCMTIREDSDGGKYPLVGACMVGCQLSNKTHYKLATSRKQDLNNKTCEPFNRKGFQCSECLEGYGLPVYSYSLFCVECSESDSKHNWVKYIAVAYLPLTLFYFVVIIFRISATSGWLVSYVALSQIVGIVIGNIIFHLDINNSGLEFLAKVIATVTTVWNLDFFRAVYPPFCLHAKLSNLHIFMLDYLLALYPMILVFLTYLFVKLHDRFVEVAWLCRPLYTCLHHFRREWDIKNSMVDALATFYLLSYVRIVNITTYILTPIYFRDMQNQRTENKYFYYDTSLSYFGQSEHLLYAIFALMFSFIFNIFPLVLLLVYPCSCFHRFLNKTGCRCHTLHVFMDTMLGAYSHQPQERSYFVVVYLLLRIFHAIAFATLNIFPYLVAVSYSMVIVIALVLICRPYKIKNQNAIDVLLLYSVLHSYSAVLTFQLLKLVIPATVRTELYIANLGISGSILPLYGLAALIKRASPWKFISQAAAMIYKRVKKRGVVEETQLYQLDNSSLIQ